MPLPSLKPSLRSKGYSSTPKDGTTRRETRLPHSEHFANPDTSQAHRSPTRLPQPPSNTKYNPGAVQRKTLLPQKEEPEPLIQEDSVITGPPELESFEKHAADKEYGSATHGDHMQQSNSLPGPRQARSRPQSMYQTSSTRPGASQRDVSGASTTSKSSVVTDKSVVSTSGLRRAQSLRKPADSSQPASARTYKAHARHLSTSTTASTLQEQREGRSRPERPKSLVIPSSNPTKASNMAAPTLGTNGTRSSQRLSALKRPTTVKSQPDRPDSSDSRTTTDTDNQTGKRREPAKEENRRQLRPNFSTFQQHFTPKKTFKAPTSTFLRPAAPDPATGVLPPEITGLQTELLQLSVLHETSAEVNRQWQCSAKRSLHEKFDQVSSMYQVMRDNERQAIEHTNIKALREWNSGTSSLGMIENIQLVSGPLHEVPSLVDSSGRFSKLVDEFDQWIAWVTEIWEAREQGGTDGPTTSTYAEGLGDSWKAENAALTRKLTAFSRDLDRVSRPAPGSSIASIVLACRRLVDVMSDELQTMQAIEGGVVAKEREWVEEELRTMAQDIGTQVDSNDGNEIWRM